MSELNKVIAETWAFGHCEPDYERLREDIFAERIKYYLKEKGYQITLISANN